MDNLFKNFKPPLGMRSRHIQSLLNSSSLRRRRIMRSSQALQNSAEVYTLDGGSGIRLQGLYSKQASKSRGLAVLLHGWEGSVNSNYIVANGVRLYKAGFDVFRLNFRDHGDTHHLNPGIFHSCRLDEVIYALRDLQNRLEAGPLFLAGYSLGGNFSLRVALNAELAGLNLAQVVAVCPVINPANAMLSMEQGLQFYERYFERKWSRSLRTKAACFHDLYGDEQWHEIKSVRERTHYLATKHAGFDSADSYFEGYSLADQRLAPLKVPSTILTSADDPVVPVSDFEDLPDNPALELIISPYGGHCGFLKNWKLESLSEDLILKLFLDAARDWSG
jgi:predicted alpha/beta-fold hydrolase